MLDRTYPPSLVVVFLTCSPFGPAGVMGVLGFLACSPVLGHPAFESQAILLLTCSPLVPQR